MREVHVDKIRDTVRQLCQDATALLLEIREMLEVQDRRMVALEQRLARLTESMTT